MLAKLLLLLPLVVPSLESYVDHNRVLLVFDSLPSDGQLQKQLKLLASHRAELKERDVVVISDLVAANDKTPDQVRAKYHIDGKFTVILLGKDGGEKLRQHTPIAYEELAGTIDAMPMRQDEMRRQK